MSEKHLKMLTTKGKLTDLKKVEYKSCESCVFRKQKKQSFVKFGKTQKAKKLKLVHSDAY